MATERRPLSAYIEENLNDLFNYLSFSPDEKNKAGNFDAFFFDVFLVANTNHDVFHGLRRVPNGFLNVYQNEFCSIKTVLLDDSKITVCSDKDVYLKGIVI